MNLVVGATGALGSSICQLLLERGEPVRALARPSSDTADLAAAGAEICHGDLKDRTSLLAACHGVNRIIATATAAARGGEDTVEAVDLLGYRNLVAAATAARIERFVFVSAHGFALDSPIALARAKASTEQLLRTSGLDYTILRPALFMDVWISLAVGAQLQAGPAVAVIGSPDQPYPFVAARNVADLAVAVAGDSRASNQTIPFSAAAVSFGSIIDRVSQLIGQPIAIDELEPDTEIPGFPPIVSKLWSFLATSNIDPIETPDVAETYGLDMISPEDYLVAVFGERETAE